MLCGQPFGPGVVVCGGLLFMRFALLGGYCIIPSPASLLAFFFFSKKNISNIYFIISTVIILIPGTHVPGYNIFTIIYIRRVYLITLIFTKHTRIMHKYKFTQ